MPDNLPPKKSIAMWPYLDEHAKEEYLRMIGALASLTEMFAQKKGEKNAKDAIPVPIISSKYQETVFQRVFGAKCEDINNSPYDASLIDTPQKGNVYLIGIKTFTYKDEKFSNMQKIAQFKEASKKWEKRENKKELARKISKLRNDCIYSNRARILGTRPSKNLNVVSIYHLLTRSIDKTNKPIIYVQECQYDTIDIENIKILPKKDDQKRGVASFDFTDGHHKYRYSYADSQLWMDFRSGIFDSLHINYVDDAYAIFSMIADIAQKQKDVINDIEESHSWKIELKPYSGLNSFYGIGSKMPKKQRERFLDTINRAPLSKTIKKNLNLFFINPHKKSKDWRKNLRTKIVRDLENSQYVAKDDIISKLFRPEEETYIPIPHAREFHHAHPDFFGEGLAEFKEDGKTLAKSKDDRTFTMILDPSGERVKMLLTQDFGKGLESKDKQSKLGHWILRDIFQLSKYEPLRKEKMKNMKINGIRMYKKKNSSDVHFEFIQIDDNNLPKDFWPSQNS